MLSCSGRPGRAPAKPYQTRRPNRRRRRATSNRAACNRQRHGGGEKQLNYAVKAITSNICGHYFKYMWLFTAPPQTDAPSPAMDLYYLQRPAGFDEPAVLPSIHTPPFLLCTSLVPRMSNGLSSSAAKVLGSVWRLDVRPWQLARRRQPCEMTSRQLTMHRPATAPTKDQRLK